MLINPSFGFNIKNEQFGNYWNANACHISNYASISPKEKLEKLRGLFKNQYRGYVVFDRPFITENRQLNFVNQEHRKLFFKTLYARDKDMGVKYLCEYNEHDNCLYAGRISESKQDIEYTSELFSLTLHETAPKNLIIFTYLNDDFSKWPQEEKIRFYIFLKNAGFDAAVKNFDASVARDAEEKEKSFIKWACGKLDIASNAVNYLNYPEWLFQKLDEIVLPKIINMPHNPTHPEQDVRYVLLCEYSYFIVARNAINPISWLAGLVSFHKLPEIWDKLVSVIWKMEGSHEDCALLLGQIIGTVLAIPTGIKFARIMTPKAAAALKSVCQKINTPLGKVANIIKKFDKSLDKVFNTPKKPASAPKKPPKTREQGRIEHAENRKKNAPNRIARKPEKPPQKTGTPLKLTASKNFVIFGGAKLTLERALEMTKKCFYSYKECLKNKSVLASSEKIKLKSLKNSIKNLRYKTETLLNEILKLKPPAHIEFECNRLLCLLKIDSYNWDKAIFYFKQMFSAYKKIGKEQTIKHVRLMRQTYKNIQKGLGNQHELLKNSIHDMALEINSLLKNADKLKTKIIVLELDIQKLIKKLISLKDTEKFVLLEKEHAVKSAELNVLKNRYESLKISFSKLKGEKPGKKLHGMKKLYRKDIADLKKELALREENLQKIKNQINEFKAGQDPLKKSLAIKSAELDALKKRKDQILETIKQLRKQESKANAKIGLLKKIYDQIQIQLQLMRMLN